MFPTASFPAFTTPGFLETHAICLCHPLFLLFTFISWHPGPACFSDIISHHCLLLDYILPRWPSAPNRLISISESLLFFFPVLNALFPCLFMADSFSSFWCQLRCHLFKDAFLGHLGKAVSLPRCKICYKCRSDQLILLHKTPQFPALSPCCHQKKIEILYYVCQGFMWPDFCQICLLQLSPLFSRFQPHCASDSWDTLSPFNLLDFWTFFYSWNTLPLPLYMVGSL